MLLYLDTADGSPPAVISRPFAGLTSASDSVVNVAAGGHIRVLRDRDLLVHAGVGSNFSPVAPAEDVFNKVNLTTWSIGVSGTLARFVFAVGLNYQSGRSDDVVLRNLLNGQEVHSPIDVRLAGFILLVGVSILI